MELLANIDVDDLDRAIEFYRNGLGLRVGRRLFGNSIAEMIGGSSKIYLITKLPGGSASTVLPLPRKYNRHWTPVHLDFVVDDVEASVRHALAAGAKLEGEVTGHVWGRIATLSDPFGHGFCILQFVGRGYDEAI